jgi:hypothetical protein
LKQIVAFCLASFSFTVLAAAQTSQHPKDTAPSVRKHIFVNGKAIAASKFIVKDGVSYVDASTLAQALGASVESEDNGLMITSAPKPSCDCERASGEGQRFSEQFRKAVAGVADEVESLRAVVLKKEKTPIGPRFDEIDYKLRLSEAHVETDADLAVYYALSYANNSLAIVYYKQSRGIPSQELQKDQLDSMMCSMESKFALMKGMLIPGGSCSVLKRMESQQLTPKPAEVPNRPDSDNPDKN